ncbi:hypothetical protein GBK02_08200 [Dechloromonas sp. TW-R-39-2]|uniref:hypothetical protein n=1 Tax=Dechloromonas sp. TW-R-39-2 TaxID=2654218 RepID=UPI00193DAB2B|nr:hypothetical protein [Dechloromonas sp. TW-R-39-2]QRM19380.1 hypothetical protein GBK02_08200 [Dechloromonas sp. TW-R-39-2]
MATPENSLAGRLISRLLGAVLLCGLIWYALHNSPAPLLAFLGIASALISIRIGQRGEQRYGRRVPVTEMIALGRQGDRAMLVGGIAGFLMLGFFAAAWFAF